MGRRARRPPDPIGRARPLIVGCAVDNLRLALEANLVFETIAVGPRTLEVAAGVRTFAGLPGPSTVEVPAEWTVVSQQGPDFITVYVRKLVEMGDVPPRLIMTFGADRGDVDTTQGARTPGTFLGQPVQWARYQAPSGDPARQVLVASTLATLGRLHVSASAQTFVPAAREDMVRIAESVRPAR